MKKIYMSLLSLMFLNCTTAKMAQDFSDTMNEHDEKVIVPPKKTATALFDCYQNGNVKEVSKEFAKQGDPLAQMRSIKDEAVIRGQWDIAQQALRDEELIKGVVAGEKKEQRTSQWIDRGMGFAAGFGSLAVSLALFYLFQKQPDNTQMNELIGILTECARNVNTAAQHFVPNGKNGCS